MPDFGTVTVYDTGKPLRSATAAEWLKSATFVNSSAPGRDAGIWHDTSTPEDTVVFVAGGPEMTVTLDDIIDLAHEAKAAGDRAQLDVCLDALDDNTDAYARCITVILSNRATSAS